MPVEQISQSIEWYALYLSIGHYIFVLSMLMCIVMAIKDIMSNSIPSEIYLSDVLKQIFMVLYVSLFISIFYPLTLFILIWPKVIALPILCFWYVLRLIFKDKICKDFDCFIVN